LKSDDENAVSDRLQSFRTRGVQGVMIQVTGDHDDGLVRNGSVPGRLGLKLRGVEVQCDGELADDIEPDGMRLVRIFSAANRVAVDTSLVGEFALQERAFGAPVAQSRYEHHGGAGRHAANGIGTLL
jgi:hypothetical protein